MEAGELRDIYERFAPVVYRRAYQLLGREADAWDIVQDVFRKLLESGGAFRRQAQPMTYVYRITTNLALNHLRGRGLRERSTPETGSDDNPSNPESVEARELLLKLFQRLDERAQNIAVLYYLDELTQEEIASTVGLSRKTVGKELEMIRTQATALGLPPRDEP
jgi:RNA polymerase sigma-70 factor (ECF subfamily)